MKLIFYLWCPSLIFLNNILMLNIGHFINWKFFQSTCKNWKISTENCEIVGSTIVLINLLDTILDFVLLKIK